MWQKEFVQALRKDFESRRIKNKRYSIRAHAQRLGVSAATLSQILREKQSWNLRVERARDILSCLNLKASQKNRLLTKMGFPPERDRQDLPFYQYDLLTDWAYMAVLSCHDLPPAQRTPEAISRRLGIAKKEIENIIKILIEQALLQKNASGVLERNPTYWMAGDGPPNEVIRRHHADSLKLAERALEEIPAVKRDFSSLTFAGSLNQLEQLREEIRLFHEKVMNLMNRDEENDEVFRLTIGIFPVHFSSGTPR